MTSKELRAVEARYHRALRRYEEAREERDGAIRATVAAGATHAQVYRSLGGTISRARIGQIAKATTDAL